MVCQTSSSQLHWRDLITCSDEELARCDIAALNLACAIGLPGTENLNVQDCLKILDRWAERIHEVTERCPWFQDNSEKYDYSFNLFRIHVMFSMLSVHYGFHYNAARIESDETKEACNRSEELFIPQRQATVSSYRVIKVYPHDPQAFTQGLVYHHGVLYEGTGLRGKSELRRVELATGKVLQTHSLNPSHFGEGITLWQDKIIQLTWTSRVGFVYNQDSFQVLGSFTYPTEGWGITSDGEQLIMSDGSDTLYFLDPETLTETGRVKVRDRGTPIVRLNELEYINGEIFANIWQTDLIVRISPETGQVLGWIDLAGLLDREKVLDSGHTPDVLNGIAYDKVGDRLFVTGKLWPQLFEIELILQK